MKKEKKKVQLMELPEIVRNMDNMYHVTRKDEQDFQNAVMYMQELNELIKTSDLEQVFFSPTEVIINAVICYNGNFENISSQIDKTICEIITKLGYMNKTQV